MKKILQTVADVAKTNLKQNGHLAPILIWYRDGYQIISPQRMPEFKDCNLEEAKTRTAFTAGIMAKKLNADLLVLVWEAAFRALPEEQDIDATEAPLTYPKTMRTECIIVNGIGFPSGKDATVIVPYKGGDGEPVEFIPSPFPEDMNYESRFTEIALDGWNKADQI